MNERVVGELDRQKGSGEGTPRAPQLQLSNSPAGKSALCDIMNFKVPEMNDNLVDHCQLYN